MAHSTSILGSPKPLIVVVAWHTLFDELESCPETVGAQRLAPDSMVKSIPPF
ncbi:MAG: hypothetical protein RIE73_15530 [Coleofasciculus sp. C1-SOL-03]